MIAAIAIRHGLELVTGNTAHYRAKARRLWRIVLDACPVDAEAISRGEVSG